MMCLFFEGSFNLASSRLNSAIRYADRREFLLQMTDALEGQRRLHDAKQLPFLILDGLLVKIGVVVMMVMVMHDHFNLALRRIGHCKAE